MRKMLLYRRKIVVESIILLIIIGSLFLYLEKKEEVFLREFRYYLLNRLEKELNVKLDIQHMDGGFFDNITLKNIKLTKELDAKSSVVFEANTIDIYYRLWGMAIDRVSVLRPFKKFMHPQRNIRVNIQNGRFSFFGSKPFINDLSGAILVREHGIVCNNISARLWNIPIKLKGQIFNSYSNPTLDLRLQFMKGPVEGSFNINNHLKEPSINGNIKIYNNSINIDGKLTSQNGILNIERFFISDNVIVNGFFDFVQHLCQLDIIIENDIGPTLADYQPGFVKVMFDFGRLPYIKTDIKLDHIKIGNVDVVSNIALKTNIKIEGSKLNSIKSELATSTTIVNYKPFKEVEAFFEFSNSILRVLYFKLGDNYNISGKINLNKPPYDANCALYFNNADLNDLALMLGVAPKDPLLGVVSGRINFNGPLNRISTKGDVNIKNGELGDIKYESMAVELEGIGAIIDIKEARLITKDSGTLLLDGRIDLRRLASCGNPIESLKLKTDQQNIIWAGWDIAKTPTSSQLNIGKSLGEELKLNFKAFTEKKDEKAFDKNEPKPSDIEIGLERKLKF